MDIPEYEPFYLSTLEDLRVEAARLGLAFPSAESLAPLQNELRLGSAEAKGHVVGNRFCAQPIAGHDAAPDGAPGELTDRRYSRLAAGGFGLIWFESTAAGLPFKPAQLGLHRGTVRAFRALVAAARQTAAPPFSPILILQLVAPPGSPHEQQAALLTTAQLAAEAGFDGVDLQACGDSPIALALADHTRPLAERAQPLCSTLAAIRHAVPDLLLATRLNACHAVRAGFGVQAGDFRRPEVSEPREVVRWLYESGLQLLNVTSSSPALRLPPSQRGRSARADAEKPDEHPLTTLHRQLFLARELRAAVPGLPVVSSGWSWLRHLVLPIAAGAIEGAWCDFIGLGRGALAWPDLPRTALENPSALEPSRACLLCSACSQLATAGQPVGCVLHDREIYGHRPAPPARVTEFDDLVAGARRCHLCRPAPCQAASPTGVDIPGFIEAFRQGDEAAAFAKIRAHDLLPELTAHVSPRWLESEGACIEVALTGRPVPIMDLQGAIARSARERGWTGLRMPPDRSGRRVAIIGGGPAGVAAAARLLEMGHEATLLEASESLGGAPARAYPASRVPHDHAAEYRALLAPALAEGRLHLETGCALGVDCQLELLLAQFDAVLLAAGVWQEKSLLARGEVPGVWPALELLVHDKRGAPPAVPARVALLTGGDTAMDAALLVHRLGAAEIHLVYAGTREAMHWHLPESWFGTPGVHTHWQTEPLGYAQDEAGRLRGLRVRGDDGRAVLLPVEMVIEAMGLQVAETLRAALPGVECDERGLVTIDACYRTSRPRVYAAGGLVNGGASVGRCVAEGLAAAAAIAQDWPI